MPRRRRRAPDTGDATLRPEHAKVSLDDATVSSTGSERGVPEEVLDRLPTDPGCYVFKDRAGKVVYVGKAKNLRSRVRQYFRPGADARPCETVNARTFSRCSGSDRSRTVRPASASR